jgi:hypothetical protein
VSPDFETAWSDRSNWRFRSDERGSLRVHDDIYREYEVDYTTNGLKRINLRWRM